MPDANEAAIQAALERALKTALAEVQAEPAVNDQLAMATVEVQRAAEQVRAAMNGLNRAVAVLAAAAGGAEVPGLARALAAAPRRQRGRRSTPIGEPEGEVLVGIPRVLTNYLKLGLPDSLRRPFDAMISKPRGPGYSDHIGMDRDEAEAMRQYLIEIRTASGQYQHVNRAVAEIEIQLVPAARPSVVNG